VQKNELRILATRCHTSSCCPTILASENGDDIVIVGSAASELLASPAVTGKVGQGEAAVVIPRDLLVEAMKSLNL
jgi:hypothetical protein